ncbi:MAG: glycosyltransferase [Planctomycetota bacterium]
MRVLLVNWALPWDGASRGGGINGYQQALALELSDRGHEVVTLASGQLYIPDRLPPQGDPIGTLTPGSCRAIRHPDWLGIRVFEIANSPVVAPSLAQFSAPELEADCPEIERAASEVLQAVRPDIVHVQSLEGFGVSLIHAAKNAGARIVFSLHNYHAVCPQVYLAPGHRGVCHDAQGGRRCEGCVEAPDRDAVIQRHLREFLERHPPAEDPDQRRLDSVGGILDDISLFTRRGRRERADRPVSWPLPVLKPGEELLPAPMAGDQRGRTGRVLAERRRDGALWTESHLLDPDLTPIGNELSPEPGPDPTSRYGVRRDAMIRAISVCDRVHAVSRFVADRFAGLGVDRSAIRTLPIGTSMVELAEWQRELLFAPPPFAQEPHRPIRLAFMGYNNWQKGLPMLADSLDLLTPEVLSRLHLAVWAFEGGSIEWRFRRLEPRLAGLEFGHGYDPHDVPWMLGGRDLGLVPSVWWDNGPQTVLEFQACGLPVLAAAAGGIPEMVRDGVDGVLFRSNDRFDLARSLAKLAGEPATLDRLRAGVTAPRTMREHTEELIEACYTG